MSRPRLVASHSAVRSSLLARLLASSQPHVARCGVLGLLLFSAGCASNPAIAPQARLTAPVTPVTRTEIEDDGLPAQVAPRQRRAGPDDPSQPWSPNYGGPMDQATRRPYEDRRVRYATEAEALAAARSRIAESATQRTPAERADARPPAAPGETRRVRYASEAEALAAARNRIAAMATPPAPATTGMRVINRPQAKLTGVDEDALVRRAIAEHEMRRRD